VRNYGSNTEIQKAGERVNALAMVKSGECANPCVLYCVCRCAGTLRHALLVCPVSALVQRPCIHGAACDVFRVEVTHHCCSEPLHSTPSCRHCEAGEGHAQARRVTALHAGRRLSGAGGRRDLPGPARRNTWPVGAREELAPQAGERLRSGGCAGRGQRNRYVAIVVLVTNTCAVCAVRAINAVTRCVFCSCSTVLRCCEMCVLYCNSCLLVVLRVNWFMYVLAGRKSSKNRAQAEIVEFTVGVLGSGQVRVVHCVKRRFLVVLCSSGAACSGETLADMLFRRCDGAVCSLPSFGRRHSVLFLRCSPYCMPLCYTETGVRRAGGAGLGSALPGVGDLLHCGGAVLLRHHHAGPRALVSMRTSSMGGKVFNVHCCRCRKLVISVLCSW
jgi:hypothetical protein